MWKIDQSDIKELQSGIDRLEEKKLLLDTKRPLPSAAMERLREALNVEWTYNSNNIEGNTLSLISLTTTGFAKSPRWIMAFGVAGALTLLIGQYAQRRFLKRRRRGTLTETVQGWEAYAPRFIPLPHPSWRNTGWLKRNPWFEAELVPVLRSRVADALAGRAAARVAT